MCIQLNNSLWLCKAGEVGDDLKANFGCWILCVRFFFVCFCKQWLVASFTFFFFFFPSIFRLLHWRQIGPLSFEQVFDAWLWGAAAALWLSLVRPARHYVLPLWLETVAVRSSCSLVSGGSAQDLGRSENGYKNKINKKEGRIKFSSSIFVYFGSWSKPGKNGVWFEPVLW